MTIADRANYGPTSHQQQAVQDLDKAWGAAVEKARSAAWDTFGAAHYPFQDPKGALQAIGDFALDQAQNAWDEIRETYGAGRTWWNQITDITHTPCEDKWNVVLTLALPAAADAVYLLLTPSPEEILENYLQPYPSKTARRGSKDDRPKDRKKSRSGKTRRSWGGIPDVDSWAAAMIPGAQMMKGRKAGAPTRWAFDAIDRLDRVLWWFLILEATEQFFTSWTSGMREARFCSQNWQHLWIGTGTKPDTGGFEAIPFDMAFPDPTQKQMSRNQETFYFLSGTGTNVHAKGSADASTTYEILGLPSNPNATVRLRIRVFSSVGLVQEISGAPVPINKLGNLTISASGQFNPALRLSIQAVTAGSVGGANVRKLSTTVTIFGATP